MIGLVEITSAHPDAKRHRSATSVRGFVLTVFRARTRARTLKFMNLAFRDAQFKTGKADRLRLRAPLR
jgi:hypothetical protein